MKDWEEARAAGDSEKKNAAAAEATKYADTWERTDCDEQYGAINRVLPSAPTNNIGHVGNVGQVGNPLPVRPAVQQIYQVGAVTPVFTQIN